MGDSVKEWIVESWSDTFGWSTLSRGWFINDWSKGDSLSAMLGKRLEKCIVRLREHHKEFPGKHRIRNTKTLEVIPWEAL